jgi:hypothetical protein
LGHCCLRDETHCVYVFKSRTQELAQIVCLDLRGYRFGKTLPGIPWALDDFDDLVHLIDLDALRSHETRNWTLSTRGINLEDLTCDDHALDFTRTFTNRAQLNVTIILLYRVILDKSVTAEKLNGIVADLYGDLTGE